MVEGDRRLFLTASEPRRRLLPIVNVTQSPEIKTPEIKGFPISPSRFTSSEGDMNIDIYTNTLCHGAGSKGRDRHCVYCFLPKKDLTNETMMSLSQFDSILNWFTSDGIRTDEKGKPRKTVSLLGGEFALHPDAKEMIKKVHATGLNLHIVTSGSDEFRELLQDQEIIEILKDESRDNLVAVSLDSVEEDVNDKWRGIGATRKAKSTIARLQELEAPFRINATVTVDAIDGLTELYDFAQDVGAKKVLVHFPSPVGMGEKFDKGPDRSEKPRRPVIPADDTQRHKGEWYDPVMESAYFYNMFERTKPDFEVECQIGHDAAVDCHLLERTSSLQFAPPISMENQDIPVVACGLNMASAKTFSAYLFRDGNLFERAGKTELSLATEERKINSLECPFSQGTGRACIYDVDLVPKKKSIEPLRIVTDQSAHRVFETITDPQTQSLLMGDSVHLITDGDQIQKGTVYSQPTDKYPALRSIYVTQYVPDRRFALKDMASYRRVVYKISPVEGGQVELAVIVWDESKGKTGTYTEENMDMLKYLIEA